VTWNLFGKTKRKPIAACPCNHDEARNAVSRVLRLCSDSKLLELLQRCESGTLAFVSKCDCLIGVLTAGMPVRATGKTTNWDSAILNPLMCAADRGYRLLGYEYLADISEANDQAADWITQHRRDKELAVLLRAEMARRGATETTSNETDTAQIENAAMEVK
jgi:hypothetical protein